MQCCVKFHIIHEKLSRMIEKILTMTNLVPSSFQEIAMPLLVILGGLYLAKRAFRLPNHREKPAHKNEHGKDFARPFEDIPCPPGICWPYIGHSLALTKGGCLWKNLKRLHEQGVPEGNDLLRAKIPVANPNNYGRYLFLYDPEDIEYMYRYCIVCEYYHSVIEMMHWLMGYENLRHEGKYPDRGQGVPLLTKLRDRRPDLFGQTKGLIVEGNEKWHEMRFKVQKDMMKLESAMMYLQPIQNSAKEFVEFTKTLLDKNGINRGNYLRDMQTYTLESMCIIAMDHKLGAFNADTRQEVQEVIESNIVFTETFPQVESEFGRMRLWSIFSPRWSKLFCKLEDASNQLMDFAKEKVLLATEKIGRKNQVNREESREEESLSVLEKLLRKEGLNSPIPTVMAIDMMSAGIETTGTAATFLLYNLTQNLEAQEKLREEVLSLQEPLTQSQLLKMKYFKACLSESLRCLPIIHTNGRRLPEDIELKGFHIPKGTMIIYSPEVIHRDQRIFPDADAFRPERWLGEEKRKIHHMALRQFGVGSRMCIGRRFAELEIQLVVIEMLRNFRVEWAGEGKVRTLQQMSNTADREIKFRFTPI